MAKVPYFEEPTGYYSVRGAQRTQWQAISAWALIQALPERSPLRFVLAHCAKQMVG